MVECQRIKDELIRHPRYPRHGWIGVDLDGTLALTKPSQGQRHIGPPVPQMLQRVRHWIKTGRTVKIFTARASDPLDVLAIHQWCVRHGLPKLEVTDRKDFSMIALWDDRAVGVLNNMGVPLLPAPMTWWQALRLRVTLLIRRKPVMRLDHGQLQGHFPLAQQAARSFLDLDESGTPGLATAKGGSPKKGKIGKKAQKKDQRKAAKSGPKPRVGLAGHPQG